jgi:hypothetical protein
VGASPRCEPEDFFPPFRPQGVQGDHFSIVRQFRAAIILSAPAHRFRTLLLRLNGLDCDGKRFRVSAAQVLKRSP